MKHLPFIFDLSLFLFASSQATLHLIYSALKYSHYVILSGPLLPDQAFPRLLEHRQSSTAVWDICGPFLYLEVIRYNILQSLLPREHVAYLLDLQRHLCLASHGQLVAYLFKPLLLALAHPSIACECDPSLLPSLLLSFLFVVMREHPARFICGFTTTGILKLPSLQHLLLEGALEFDIFQNVIFVIVVVQDDWRIFEGHDIVMALLKVSQGMVYLDTFEVARGMISELGRH